MCYSSNFRDLNHGRELSVTQIGVFLHMMLHISRVIELQRSVIPLDAFHFEHMLSGFKTRSESEYVVLINLSVH
jgi:hypothetical protein